MEPVDGPGDLLQELVNLVGVVAAQPVPELDLTQDPSGDLHIQMVRGQ